MYVCLCAGVTDGRVRELVRGGNTTLRELGQACGAGAGCGTCALDLKRLVVQTLDERRPCACADRALAAK